MTYDTVYLMIHKRWSKVLYWSKHAEYCENQIQWLLLWSIIFPLVVDVQMNKKLMQFRVNIFKYKFVIQRQISPIVNSSPSTTLHVRYLGLRGHWGCPASVESGFFRAEQSLSLLCRRAAKAPSCLCLYDFSLRARSNTHSTTVLQKAAVSAHGFDAFKSFPYTVCYMTTDMF